MKIFRDGVINWQHINKEKKLVNQSKVDWITNYSKQRLENLNQVIGLANASEVQPEEQAATALSEDSDDDFYGKNLEVGTMVDA